MRISVKEAESVSVSWAYKGELMSKGPQRRGAKEHADKWIRRQAVQIAGMLPDDPDEALKVLEHARGIVEFMSGKKPSLRVVSGDRPPG